MLLTIYRLCDPNPRTPKSFHPKYIFFLLCTCLVFGYTIYKHFIEIYDVNDYIVLKRELKILFRNIVRDKKKKFLI